MNDVAPPDVRRLDDATRARVVEEHRWLAESLAREMAWLAPKTLDGDVLGSAYEGLTLAAAHFDPTRKRPFAKYAHKWIVGAILDEVERVHPGFTRVHRVLLDACEEAVDEPDGAPLWDDGGDALDPITATMWVSDATLRLARRDDGRSEAEQRALRLLDEELERLGESGRTLLLRHAEGATWAAVAKELGVSESTAKRRGAELRALLSARLRARGVRQ
ncbi:MAG: sigma-70 family RNA polymerase sigma factor [Polyangiaceae bacterium]